MASEKITGEGGEGPRVGDVVVSGGDVVVGGEVTRVVVDGGDDVVGGGDVVVGDAIVGGGDAIVGDVVVEEKKKWSGNCRVYTRRFKGLKKNLNTTTLNNNNNHVEEQVIPIKEQLVASVDIISEPLSRKIANSTEEHLLIQSHVLAFKEAPLESVVSAPVPKDVMLGNRIKINLASRSKMEISELKKKLESELIMVRSMVSRIEAREAPVRVVSTGLHDGRTIKIRSDNKSFGVRRESVRPLNRLSVSVVENSQSLSENLEREKRTPKANQFYRKSEFLLANDKFPPAESNKKSKKSGEMGHPFGTGKKFYKSCSALLERLMKHKHGWVFNEPVNVENLGLIDYFTIIKYPMDLGTIKSRLTSNWYKSPKEFAEDVRLTFRNAMVYNPVGHDVNTMAGQLAKVFEDKWVRIEAEYNRDIRLKLDYEAGLLTPTSKRQQTPHQAPFTHHPFENKRILDRSQSVIQYVPRLVRPPAQKKPKAKDPNKRLMTFEEKQKLSNNLLALPHDKLDDMVQIIKKGNSAISQTNDASAPLSQTNDAIEVDIDNVDNDTLWELDRFVTNYKKFLSKHKRRTEQAIQAREEFRKNPQEEISTLVMAQKPPETKTDGNNTDVPPKVEGEKQGENASSSSSSSSSSSDSDSSSSDSDSDSSSSGG